MALKVTSEAHRRRVAVMPETVAHEIRSEHEGQRRDLFDEADLFSDPKRFLRTNGVEDED